jgi:cell division topological specificity factor
MLDQMKDEMIAVISRYVEIDPAGVEVMFDQSKRENRLVADIPVVGPAQSSSGRGASNRGIRRG